MKCAYCGREARGTKEHIISSGILDLFPECYLTFDEKRGVIHQGDPMIKNVCADCNNNKISYIDSYAKNFIGRYFVKNYGEDKQVKIEYDYTMIQKVLLKYAFNDLRSRRDDISYFDEELLQYLMNESDRAPKEYISVLAGLAVNVSPAPDFMFGNLKLRWCKNPVFYENSTIRHINYETGQVYWINTSGNDFVKRFIDKANKTTRDEIERLVAGEAIEKMVRLELTYDEIDNSIDNMWSVLFTTGYLTQTGMTEQGAYKLVIPNKEVREVYKFQIQEWFKKSVFSNTEQLTAFWNGVEEGNTEAIEKYLNRILSNSISVFDTKTPDKESSYHTFLVGLLVRNANWLVKSNVEAGEGFADIIVETEDPDAGIVMELKYVKVASELEKACEKALAQIKDRRYEEYLKNDGRNNILFYGLAFCKKRCKVIVESRGMYSTVL